MGIICPLKSKIYQFLIFNRVLCLNPQKEQMWLNLISLFRIHIQPQLVCRYFMLLTVLEKLIIISFRAMAMEQEP